MTSPDEIRRRIRESCAFLESAHRAWDQAHEDHEARVANIQADCQHANVRGSAWAYGREIVCADCGATMESVEE